MACSSSCSAPGSHASWGECVRSKGLKIAFCGQGGGDATVQKKWDKNLDDYRAARAQGIQPAGSSPQQVRQAVEASNLLGRAVQVPS